MKSSSKKSLEYTNFEQALGRVLQVSHEEMKATLSAEKQAKKPRRKRTSARVSSESNQRTS